MFFKLFLKTSSDGDPVISPDSLFKFFCYYCKKGSLYFQLKSPLQLIITCKNLSCKDIENRLFLYTAYFYIFWDSECIFFFSCWLVPITSAFIC